MNKKELTSMQIARRKYEEKNKEERKEKNAQFSTFIPREIYNEINEFLEKNNITKVALIMAGYEALKEEMNKKTDK